ncbi:MAG: E3 binding domain-containing protein, partial [Candidatus Dadabacteria bacterium]|nr:E3 binding domain-containing protein [Candidatus Dadabacteria bacterium]
MAIEIKVPELGESVVEATIIRWFKSEGDPVKIGEALVELETEKANFEVAAEKQGVLSKILKQDGEDVEVGDVLGSIEEGKAGEAAPAKEEAKAPEPAPEPEPVKEAPKQETEEKVTPVARKVAEENNVDLSKVQGTGPSGRVTKEDVEAYIAKAAQPAKEEPVKAPSTAVIQAPKEA